MRPANTILFGVYEVDLRAGELRKHGLRVKLQAQPFGILALLLERPGEIVDRAELRQKLWPTDVFVDFDQGLNKAVNKLRDALGDSVFHNKGKDVDPRVVGRELGVRDLMHRSNSIQRLYLLRFHQS